MNHKALIDNVAEKFELKRGQARKIVDHILIQLLESGLSGEGFASPIMRVVSKDVEEKITNTPEGVQTIPAKRIMRIAKSKPYVSASDNTTESSVEVTV